jgi:hypothetical protein
LTRTARNASAKECDFDILRLHYGSALEEPTDHGNSYSDEYSAPSPIAAIEHRADPARQAVDLCRSRRSRIEVDNRFNCDSVVPELAAFSARCLDA